MSDGKLENVESPTLATYESEECEQKSTLNADDSISRQKAIERLTDIRICLDDESQQFMDLLIREISDLPSAQPERLTDDDFETIRIHLNAYKEKLCNQQRWKEAEEYQRIIDRFMVFASAETEIVRCKDCKHWDTTWQNDWAKNYHYCPLVDGTRNGDWYCADAERRTDEKPMQGM